MVRVVGEVWSMETNSVYPMRRWRCGGDVPEQSNKGWNLELGMSINIRQTYPKSDSNYMWLAGWGFEGRRKKINCIIIITLPQLRGLIVSHPYDNCSVATPWHRKDQWLNPSEFHWWLTVASGCICIPLAKFTNNTHLDSQSELRKPFWLFFKFCCTTS